MHTRPHHKLIAWERAHELCMLIYRFTSTLPSDEKFGLTSQIRRSAMSVSMNIAEGNARRSNRDKARFFEISLSSLDELHYQCQLSKELQYIDEDTFIKADTLIHRVSFLISKLRKSFL